MPKDIFKVQIACKNCEKLFTIAVDGEVSEEAGFDSIKEVLGAWGELLKNDLQSDSVRFHTCPSCKRAYVYTASDAFIAYPPSSTDETISSTILIPKPTLAELA